MEQSNNTLAHEGCIPHDEIMRGLIYAIDTIRMLIDEKLMVASDAIGSNVYERILSEVDELITAKIVLERERIKRL